MANDTLQWVISYYRLPISRNQGGKVIELVFDSNMHYVWAELSCAYIGQGAYIWSKLNLKSFDQHKMGMFSIN